MKTLILALASFSLLACQTASNESAVKVRQVTTQPAAAQTYTYNVDLGFTCDTLDSAITFQADIGLQSCSLKTYDGREFRALANGPTNNTALRQQIAHQACAAGVPIVSWLPVKCEYDMDSFPGFYNADPSPHTINLDCASLSETRACPQYLNMALAGCEFTSGSFRAIETTSFRGGNECVIAGDIAEKACTAGVALQRSAQMTCYNRR